MNTLFKPISWLFDKLKIKRFKTPGFIKNIFRLIVLIVFVAAMIVTKKLGLKINLILYITVFAVFLTLSFDENLWHRHLCLFGTILSLTSRASRYRIEIDEEVYISCGKCVDVCPVSICKFKL